MGNKRKADVSERDLARVFADHYFQRDDAFDGSCLDTQARIMSGINAVLGTLQHGLAGK